MRLKAGKLTLDLSRNETKLKHHHNMPLALKFWWSRGAGYIGGWTGFIRLTPITRHCRTMAAYGHKKYLTPIVAFTRNANKYAI